MATSIGEKLRLERETRGIALRDISEQTRISMRYLEAIETDDYRRLPGGIFNRSFIRAYAKFVGYDEDKAIEEYGNTMREHGLGDEPPKRGHRSYGRRRALWSFTMKTLLLAIVILGCCRWPLGGLYFYQKRVAGRSAARRPRRICR